MHHLPLFATVSAAVLLVGCGKPSATRPFGRGDAGTSVPMTAGSGINPDEAGEPDDTSDGADDGAEDDGLSLDVAPGTEPPDPSDPEGCAAVSETAEGSLLPVDIIFAIDNSGSMGDDILETAWQLNVFSLQLAQSGVDARVAMVSGSFIGSGNGICVDPPLGVGDCPYEDDNPPYYTHVPDISVGSFNAWEVVLDTAGHWTPNLRPDGQKHVVVISDDASDMSLATFDAGFRALGRSYEDYVHHSIVAHSECSNGENVGWQYIALSDMTGGVAADICLQDYPAVFDVLSTAVITGATLGCSFTIPPAPEGESLDPTQVNLEFWDGVGGGFGVGAVADADACVDVVDGWYYDDPLSPTTVVVCPQTCEKIQGFPEGSVDILFGCETEPATPVG